MFCLLHKLLTQGDHLPWIDARCRMYAACIVLCVIVLFAACIHRTRTALPQHSRPITRTFTPPRSNNCTPLIYAASCGHLDTVRVLLLAGATADDTAIAGASRNGHEEITQLLRTAMTIQRVFVERPSTPLLTTLLES
jgi:hypothetical protein